MIGCDAWETFSGSSDLARLFTSENIYFPKENIKIPRVSGRLQKAKQKIFLTANETAPSPLKTETNSLFRLGTRKILLLREKKTRDRL